MQSESIVNGAFGKTLSRRRARLEVSQATLARLAGAPTDPGAGLELLRNTGEPVRAGEPLYRLYGSEPADFGFATEAALEDSGVRVVS